MVYSDLKSVVVGEAGAGKTSISTYFCLGACPNNPNSTVVSSQEVIGCWNDDAMHAKGAGGA